MKLKNQFNYTIPKSRLQFLAARIDPALDKTRVSEFANRNRRERRRRNESDRSKEVSDRPDRGAAAAAEIEIERKAISEIGIHDDKEGREKRSKVILSLSPMDPMNEWHKQMR